MSPPPVGDAFSRMRGPRPWCRLSRPRCPRTRGSTTRCAWGASARAPCASTTPGRGARSRGPKSRRGTEDAGKVCAAALAALYARATGGVAQRGGRPRGMGASGRRTVVRRGAALLPAEGPAAVQGARPPAVGGVPAGGARRPVPRRRLSRGAPGGRGRRRRRCLRPACVSSRRSPANCRGSTAACRSGATRRPPAPRSSGR